MIHDFTMTLISIGLLLLGWLFLQSAVDAWMQKRDGMQMTSLLLLAVFAVTSGLGILTTVF